MSTVKKLLASPEFAPSELTAAINVPPYKTGRLAQLGIFVDDPIPTTFVRILIENGQITIIPARERGGPSHKNVRGGAGRVLLDIPHFPLGDAIGPSDLQNLAVYGEDMEKMKATLMTVLNKRLLEMRSKHDATLHHMEWGAINGIVLDADGTELVNLWDEFDVVQPTVFFDINNASSDIAAKTRTVKQTVSKALRGAAMSGVRIFAGPTFYEKYVGHATVKAAYAAYQAAGQKNPQRDDVSDEFFNAGVTIERVDETFNVLLANGTFEERDAVPDDGAIAIPLGTPYFKRYLAPPDTLAGANNAPNPEDRVYVSTEELDHDKGLDIHTESNVLPVCLNPELMVRLDPDAS